MLMPGIRNFCCLCNCFVRTVMFKRHHIHQWKPRFSLALISVQGLLQSDNPHRPMDLRVSCLPAEAAAAEAAALSESMSDGGTGWGPLLCAGTAIAAEARAAVKVCLPYIRNSLPGGADRILPNQLAVSKWSCVWRRPLYLSVV